MGEEEMKKGVPQEDKGDLEAQIASEIAAEKSDVEEKPAAEEAPGPAAEGKVEGPVAEPEVKEDAPAAEPELAPVAEEQPGPAPEEPVAEPAQTKDKPDKSPAKDPDGEVPEEPAEEKPRGPKKTVGLPPDKVLLFGKYNMAEVTVQDPGLAKYLNLNPIIVAHTGAKHANRSFGKTKMHIIERLVNNMMRTEKFTGKKQKSYKVVKNAFEIIEKRTKSHPVQVLIDAIENSAPREEVTRLRYGGISVPKAVDTSSSRRLDLAFRNLTKGAVNSSYKSAKPIEMCLANEIMLAAKKDMNSFAVSKKEEIERIAASAR